MSNQIAIQPPGFRKEGAPAAFREDGVHKVIKSEIGKKRAAAPQDQDAIMFAFLQVLESVNVQQNTAQTQAKILQSNAIAQENLDSAADKLNFQQLTPGQIFGQKSLCGWDFKNIEAEYLFSVIDQTQFAQKMKSKAHYSKFTPKAKARFDAWLQDGGWRHGKKQGLNVTYNKTLTAKAMFQIQYGNQEIEKDRSFISNQIMLAQQNAQVCETQLDTTVNSQEQSSQIDSGLMQMLTQLTQKIDSSNR